MRRLKAILFISFIFLAVVSYSQDNNSEYISIGVSERLLLNKLKSSLNLKGVCAQVNNEVILVDDVYKRADIAFLSLAKNISGEKLLKKAKELFIKVLDELIEEKLVTEYAKKENISVTDNEVKEFEAIEIRKFGSKQLFLEKLFQSGISYEAWKKKLYIELLERRIVNKLLEKPPVWVEASASDSKKPVFYLPTDLYVSPREIKDYYEKNKKEFYIEAKIKIVGIALYYADEATKNKLKEIYESLHRQLEQGADFQALAHWYSSGRSVFATGWIPVSAIRDTPLKVLLEMPINKPSQVIDTGNSLGIYKVVGRKPAIKMKLKDKKVQEMIRIRLLSQRISNLINTLKDHLKSQAYIKKFLD